MRRKGDILNSKKLSSGEKRYEFQELN